MDVAVKTLSRNFMLDDAKAFAEALFADDGVQERMAMVMAAGNSYHRFTQRYLSRLDVWRDRMTAKYERRTRPTIEIMPFGEKPKPEPAQPSEVKYERPPVDSHKQIKVYSIIDVYAWDQA